MIETRSFAVLESETGSILAPDGGVNPNREPPLCLSSGGEGPDDRGRAVGIGGGTWDDEPSPGNNPVTVPIT
jgi:hypothetical protein